MVLVIVVGEFIGWIKVDDWWIFVDWVVVGFEVEEWWFVVDWVVDGGVLVLC